MPRLNCSRSGFACLGLLLCLAACAGDPGSGPTIESLATRVTELEAQLAQQTKLNTMQAEANRILLTEIEQLKNAEEMAKMSAGMTEPAAKQPPAKAPSGYTAANAALAGGEPFAEAGGGPGRLIIPNFDGPAGLHLGSFADAANLSPAWQQYQRRFPSLEGLEVRIEYVTLANGTPFLRMKAGPFASPGAAAAPCRAILDSGAYCAIQPFSGDPIDTFIIDP